MYIYIYIYDQHYCSFRHVISLSLSLSPFLPPLLCLSISLIFSFISWSRKHTRTHRCTVLDLHIPTLTSLIETYNWLLMFVYKQHLDNRCCRKFKQLKIKCAHESAAIQVKQIMHHLVALMMKRRITCMKMYSITLKMFASEWKMYYGRRGLQLVMG